jgi:beta-glucosidase
MYAIGIDKWGPLAPTVDMANHNETALKTARQGIVLLKNERALLPLSSDKPLKIAVIMDNH